MITNTGKAIMVKYLLGQAPAYASFIALGCGAKPLDNISFAVSNKATSGTTVTLTTTSIHNLKTGDYITVSNIDASVNGVYPLINTTSGTTTLQYVMPISPLVALTGLTASVTINTGIVNVASTSGLRVGQTLTQTAGTTALAAGVRIVSITSATQFVVSAAHTATASITFTANDAMTVPIYPYGKVAHNYSNKENLDFEMFRVPITSRGYVTESGISKVVLTANIPSSDRYEISEVGVYSAQSNPSAQLSDSNAVFTFVGQEGWEYDTGSESIEIPSIVNKLDNGATAGTIDTTESDTTGDKAFIANSSNSTLGTEIRIKRHERPRNLGDSIFLRGDSSTIIKVANITSVTKTATTATYTTTEQPNLIIGDSVTIAGIAPEGYNGTFTVTAVDAVAKTFTINNSTNATITDGVGTVTLPRFSVSSGNHIHNQNNITTNFNYNSPIDELRLAFSVISTAQSDDGTDAGTGIGQVRIVVEFGDTVHRPGAHANLFAQMEIELNASTIDFSTNRYFVVSKQLQELKKYGNFNWNDADVVSIFVSVINKNGVASDKYYVALDGLRLENVSSINPLYGLTGYSVIQNVVQGTTAAFAQPIIKNANTSNFIEFRYSVDVL